MGRGTVLVVDDDPGITEFVQLALEMDGYTVLSASGAAALPLAQVEHPDMILLDIAMPGMDGIEVSRRLRADAATADIPIVVMSAQDRLQATSALMPVDDRLPKPFELSRLYATVDRWASAG